MTDRTIFKLTLVVVFNLGWWGSYLFNHLLLGACK